MNILKFGGTSVGSVERIKALAHLINSNDDKIIVLSAMSGTTNALVEISKALYNKQTDVANKLIIELENKYKTVVDELFSSVENKEKGNDLIKNQRTKKIS